MDPFAISSALIEGRPGGQGLGSQGDTFFTEAAQSLFAGLIAISRNLTELKSYLFGGDLALIREKLTEAGEISAQFVKEERLAANVMASFSTKLYWLKLMRDDRSHSRSISNWVRDDSDTSWIFLIAEEKDWDASKHYFRLILTIAGKAAFGRGEQGSGADIYEIQDEIETIGFQPDFVQKLNIGRKDGYVVLAGLQAFSQFQTIYGDHQAQTILNGFQNRFLFRSEDFKATKMMSEMTGPGRWRVISENISTDGKPSIGKKEESRPAVRPEVFYALRPGECVMKVSGCNPVRILLEYRDWPRFQ
jgi:type IV secretory pathway TraG/TraD family ATPase VirD4